MPKIKSKFKNHNLYFVLSSEYAGETSVLDMAEQALASGVDILQMREKHMPARELRALGKGLRDLCRQKQAVFIVNDDPHLAKELGADGVHLGQEDMKKYPVDYARRLIGEDKIIGVSTHSLSEFKHANNMDCDYAAFGPLFPTKTKDYYIGIQDVEEVLAIASKPVVFIGGIKLANIDSVLEKGARNIAVIRAIAESGNIAFTVKSLKHKIKKGTLLFFRFCNVR